MLNLKKGLALVLAAATAFTFAPVANLGNAVQAEAATIPYEETVNVDRAIYTDTATTTLYNQSNDNVGTAYKSAEGILLEVKIATVQGATYKIFSQPSDDSLFVVDSSKMATNSIVTGSVLGSNPKVTVYKSDSTFLKFDAVDKLKANYDTYRFTATGSETTVLLWATKPGKGTVSFVQDPKTSDTNLYSNITVTVPENKASVTGLTVEQAPKSTASATNGYVLASDYTSNKKTARNNNGVYELQLNSADAFYLQGTKSTTIKSWTGATLTGDGLKDNKIDDRFTYLNVYDVYHAFDNTYYSNESNKKASDVKNTTDPLYELVPKSRTYEEQSLDLTFKTTQGIDVDTSLEYTVDPSDNAIDNLYWAGADITNKGTSASHYVIPNTTYETYVDGTGTGKNWTVIGLDSQIHTEGTLQVKAESGNVTFKSSDETSLTVTPDANNPSVATVKALKAGTPTVYVFVGSTQNNNALVAQVHFDINAVSTDEISVDDVIDLDVPSQTATPNVKSTVLQPKSAGNLKITMKQLTGDNVIAFNPTTGQIDAKEITGRYQEATIQVTTTEDKTRNIRGASKVVTVRVWTLPAADYDLDPVVIEQGKDMSLKATVRKPNPYSIVFTSDNSGIYTLSNPEQGLLHTNDQTTSRLYGQKVGTGKYTAEILATSTTRPTKKTATVTVTSSSVVNTITPDDNSKALALSVGDDPVTITASSSLKTEVTFDDSKLNGIATVQAGATSGSAIVTPVKAGKGVIVAKSKGAVDYEIPVVVTEKEQTVAPEAVTGVKVSNAKGAYVSVKWASQGKNINYRVWKKVGNGKWIGKNVAGSKTTLKVKKGAKVQVKVKAYVKDSTGKTTWGPTATKAKTFKTDKK